MASEDTVTVEHHGPPPSQQRKTWEPYGKIATRQGVNMGALKCKVCDRVYSKSEHLKRHQRSRKILRCTPRPKPSKTYQTIVDTKERPYQCPVCKKYFSRRFVLPLSIGKEINNGIAMSFAGIRKIIKTATTLQRLHQSKTMKRAQTRPSVATPHPITAIQFLYKQESSKRKLFPTRHSQHSLLRS